MIELGVGLLWDLVEEPGEEGAGDAAGAVFLALLMPVVLEEQVSYLGDLDEGIEELAELL